jgi:ubiquinone biosynthesis protein Coq4
VTAGRDAFERMARAGGGDAGALGLDLRQDATDLRLRAFAAMAVHAAAAAPERMIEIYDRAAAGWLGKEATVPQGRPSDPLLISPRWWKTLWSIAIPPAGAGRQRYAELMMELAGELDAGINPRMAAAALEFPGVAEAATGELSQPYDFEWLSQFSPASLGYALSQELISPGSPASDPYWTSVIPYLRHMPAPLNHINVQVIQSMSLWGLVAGYSLRGLDRVALGGFLMGQVGHHYSALASAVTLTNLAATRPDNLDAVLDCLFRGWTHGRQTRPLITVAWQPLWSLRVDQVREALQIQAFHSAHAKGAQPSKGWAPRIV